MTAVLLVLHALITIGLIVLILLQRSEGGALGMGGGPGGLMSGRAAGNILTRGTSILGAAFFVTSISLTVLASLDRNQPTTLERQLDAEGDVLAPVVIPAEDGVDEADDAAEAPVEEEPDDRPVVPTDD